MQECNADISSSAKCTPAHTNHWTKQQLNTHARSSLSHVAHVLYTRVQRWHFFLCQMHTCSYRSLNKTAACYTYHTKGAACHMQQLVTCGTRFICKSAMLTFLLVPNAHLLIQIIEQNSGLLHLAHARSSLSHAAACHMWHTFYMQECNAGTPVCAKWYLLVRTKAKLQTQKTTTYVRCVYKQNLRQACHWHC